MNILPDGRQLWHTPLPDLPADAETRLHNFWASATQSLLIVDYSFNLTDVEPIITALLAKGVKVIMVLDRSQSKGNSEVPIIKALKAISDPNFQLVIGTSSMHQIIHDKFSVVDDIHAQYGSFNYTLTASKEDNFFFIEAGSPVASALTNIGLGIRDWILKNEPQT